MQSVTSLLQSASGITKCDRLLLQSASGISKCDRLLLQSVSGITKCDRLLLQSASGITKCNRLLLQSASGITKCDRLLLQSASGITKCDSYYKVRRNTCQYDNIMLIRAFTLTVKNKNFVVLMNTFSLESLISKYTCFQSANQLVLI